MDWTNESILQFLRLYKSHQCIWDTKQCKQHRNRDLVNEAWLDIQNNMSIPCTIPQLKKKKESLMSAYRAYKTKIKNSTAVVGGTAYKPSWFAFATMDSFLSTVYLCNTSNWRNQSENEQNTENTDAQLEINPGEEETPRKRKRQSLDTPQDEFSQMSHETPQIDDECETITKLWAKKLRKLPEDRRDELIYKINNLVYKECVEYHRRSEDVLECPVQVKEESTSDCSEELPKSDEESNGFISVKTEPEDS